MSGVKDLRVYNNIAKELQVITGVLSATNLSAIEQKEAAYQWVSNQDFTIIGLYAKAPRYASGKEVYQEFYNAVTPDGEYVGLAVKENYSDIVEPRMVSVNIQVVDDVNNQLYFGGDWTDEMASGDTHVILSGTTYQPIHQLNLINATYISGSNITIATYQPNVLAGISVGDLAYFQKGQNLVGIEHMIEWFDNSGTTVISKSFYARFESFEAGVHEFNRRQNTVNQMISAADATSIQPYIKEIYEHYRFPYIDNYINVGDAQGWKDAIDTETDASINFALDIVIPFTNIEGETVYKKIRDYIKDELYVGYK